MSTFQQVGLHLDPARLRVLIEAGQSATAQRELEDVLGSLLATARELTGAQHAAIKVLDDDADEFERHITARGGDRPRVRGRSIDVAILIDDEAWGYLCLADKEHAEFGRADEETAIVLARWAAIAVSNARAYHRIDQRRAELERSVHALEATSEIGRVLGGETQLDRVLELVATRSRALVEARGVMILLADNDQFLVAATAGDIPQKIAGRRLPARGTRARRVLASGNPDRIASISGQMRATLSELGLHPRSALLSPLVFRGSNVGVIEAFDRVGGPEFRIEDERLLLAAAASAATAVATAQSLQRERLRRSLAAAEEERRRWARELHDETLQGLGGLRVLLSSARRSTDVAALHATLETAVDQLADEITSLRALITELRPAALDELGLRPALEALIDRVRVTHRLDVATTIELEHGAGTRETRLEPDVEIAIYRTVQESLTNAAKHADARCVDVVVVERGAEVEIAVRDDGAGFDVGAPTGGFGLTGIRERISLAGGRLEIVSSGQGTAVLATVPSARASAA
ncbi:MAG TPA: GAF domain-containing sensor histidine kinase [Solirubrobacteraceae bacterium]|nr:GAF domain-containing sensor histidine kinase [Solirubrobacteraceae bacterium]